MSLTTPTNYGARYGQANGDSVNADAIVTATPYTSEVLADSPVGYWRLGESEGTTAADSSGNGFDGSYNGTPTLGAPTPIADGDTAVEFDGLSQYALIGHNAGFNLTTQTIEFLVYFNDVDSDQVVISKTETGVSIFDVVLDGASSKLVFTNSCTTDTTDEDVVATSDQVFADATWYHVAITWDGANEVKIYVDGVLDATETSTFTNPVSKSNTGDIYIGRNSEAATDFINAIVDEVAIYGTVLSGARIATHYDAIPLVASRAQTYDDLITLTGAVSPVFVEIQPQGGDLRIVWDGSEPTTSTGRFVAENEVFTLFGVDASNLRFIEDANNAATSVWVQFGGK